MFYFDPYYFILVVPALLFGTFAQMRVKSAFSKYSKVPSRRGMTGRDAARRILNANGLTDVTIEHVAGNMTDHFDPKKKAIFLSDTVDTSTSVAAIGVAAHEAGHAVQHATGYFGIKLRTAVIPIANFGSMAFLPLILIGLIFEGLQILITVGILLYAAVFVFQLVTLPVEFNASRRAVAVLSEGYLDSDEVPGVKKVLSAAALTYVAAMVASLAQLLRLILLYGGRRRR